MPIYAYKCASCGHADDVLQKMSDDALTHCPACGAQTYSKQVTAPAFALKGSGWYVTDFRGGNKPADGDAGKAGAEKGADKGADKATTSADSKPDASGTSSAPAAATTAAPASASPTPAKPVAPAGPSPAPASTPSSS